MTLFMTRALRGASFCAVLALAACGIPRAGPTKNELFSGSVLRQGDAFVIQVTDRVNQIASSRNSAGFSAALRNAGKLGSDSIRPGDTLTLSIWENVENGLFGSPGGGVSSTSLREIQVDAQGFIFVPYAGRIRAAGNTPEAIRRIITNKLADQTPDPQVQVALLSGEGASVTILGSGSGQGVQTIDRNSRTLLQMLGKAGGIVSDGTAVTVTLSRGNLRETVFLDDILQDPRQDIALRDGDTLLVDRDRRFFNAFGATGSQRELTFNRSSISAMEALAQLGGLNPTTADPTGVFILRNEAESITESLTGVDLTGTQRVIYVLDLTVPNGMFQARDFLIRSGDTVYVTEAPLVQFNKTIAAITGSLNSASSLATAAQAATGAN